MATLDDSAQQGRHFVSDSETASMKRAMPIIQSSTTSSNSPSPEDPMDVASPAPNMTMGPPARNSPDGEANGNRDQSGVLGEHGNTSGPSAAAAAQAGAQAPKVVQTAFIHKLYNMLEDQSIQHLISWSNSAESFVMSPSNDFSKVLSQYFKHTNISSFVRQLNMYGFHKVSDVFHTGSPDSTLWEFKHGNGNFKRGDLVGLREIKRRASRHALVHRDSYPSVKPPPYTQPGTPAEPIQPVQETAETRLSHIEYTLHDMHGRLAERDSQIHQLLSRNHQLTEALVRSLQLSQDMTRAVSAVVNDPNHPAFRGLADIQAEFERVSQNIMRPMEEPQDAPFSGSRPYFSQLSLENAPISPRQLAQDDPRRPPQMMSQPPRQPFRPAVPPHLSIQLRRYGSIGNSSAAASPSSLRYAAQPPPPPPPPSHPLANVQSPPTNLPRRHTSADIREHAWRPTPSPFASGQATSQWPSSPDRRTSTVNEESQRIRDSFSSYSLVAASAPHQSSNGSRPSTPPFGGQLHPNGTTAVESLGTWNWGQGGRGDKFGGGGGLLKDSSGPPTRRGSMAHILNPAETAERDEEEDEREDDRKRKRM